MSQPMIKTITILLGLLLISSQSHAYIPQPQSVIGISDAFQLPLTIAITMFLGALAVKA